VLLVRKIGAPFQPELAIGALGEGGIRIVDQEMLTRLGIRAEEVEQIESRELQEIARQAKKYRPNRPAANLVGKTAVIVDDGIATGSTALAACAIARRLGAGRVVMAAPVAPRHAPALFESATDEFVVVVTPRRLGAIGFFYADFEATTDDEVLSLLEQSRGGG
jgi:putative phosphoribosyl transferase